MGRARDINAAILDGWVHLRHRRCGLVPCVLLVLALATSPTAQGQESQQEILLKGTWNSSIGFVYEIARSQEGYTWWVAQARQRATITVAGREIETSWTDAAGSGHAKGRITQVDQGWATRMEWANGVVFFREPPPVIAWS